MKATYKQESAFSRPQKDKTAVKATTGKLQRNNYQDVQCERSFAGKTSSVPLIAPTHAKRIAK